MAIPVCKLSKETGVTGLTLQYQILILGPFLLAFESHCREKHNFVKRNAISIVEGGKARLPSNNSRTPSKNPNKTIYFIFCNSDLH
ncbi:hypothetical protein L1887_04869 [Cichorium endivia]|nr:hypothetical protein L1887_04869 [Cichorium endivia]